MLLDTHVFLWAISGDERLTRQQRALFEDGASELWLSAASIWEIVIKCGLGRLRLPGSPVAYVVKQMERNRISMLGIHPSHLAALEELPPYHRDPFDRMLVAQANAEGMKLLSSDPAVLKYLRRR